jgi:hypothetical protein
VGSELSLANAAMRKEGEWPEFIFWAQVQISEFIDDFQENILPT